MISTIKPLCFINFKQYPPLCCISLFELVLVSQYVLFPRTFSQMMPENPTFYYGYLFWIANTLAKCAIIH